MAVENKNIKKFYQQSSKPFNYIPSDIVSGDPIQAPSMSGLMRIDPATGSIWVSAGNTLVSDWKLLTGGGGGGAVAVQYNGGTVSAAASTLNFIGTNLSVDGDPLVNITIPQVPIIIKSTTPGTEVKNTLVATQTYSVKIDANTVKPNSVLRITYRIEKTSTEGNTDFNIKIGPTNNYTAYSSVGFARLTYSLTNAYLFGQLVRQFTYDGITTSAADNKSPLFTDDTEALSFTKVSIDWTVDQYVMFGIQHQTSLNDVAKGVFYCIEIY